MVFCLDVKDDNLSNDWKEGYEEQAKKRRDKKE